MRKRERENPCGVCGHYHKHDEVCGICGHRMPISSQDSSPPSVQLSAFPSEILPDFLYLGSYDNASRSELLKAQGISRILNTVASCQNLYKNNFVYHCLPVPDDKTLPFHDAFLFLEQCEREKARVLVHCMSGKNRSPAIVIAYLMKSKVWRLAQSYQWVKDRRPSIELSQPVYQQLQEYEMTLFGTADASNPELIAGPPLAAPTLSFGFGRPSDLVSVPTFNNATTTSIFSRSPVDHPLHEFTFGAGAGQEAKSVTGTSFSGSAQQQNCSNAKNNSMDSS